MSKLLMCGQPHESCTRIIQEGANEDSIIFVAGAPCSGKTTFIKENFADRKIIDIRNYQGKMVTVQSLLEAYEKCKSDIVNCIRNGEKIVIEHTLLKAERRKPYIDAIKAASNQEIEIYFLMPNTEKHQQYFNQRGIPFLQNEIHDYQALAEIPTIEEGFSRVIICH